MVRRARNLVLLVVLALVAGTFAVPAAAGAEGRAQHQPAGRDGRTTGTTGLIVRWEPGTADATRRAVLAAHDLPGHRRLDLIDADAVTVADVGPAGDALAAHPAVASVEPDVPVFPAAEMPDDEYFDEQWGLHNTGQTVNGQSGVDDVDIDAPEAWEVTTGDSDVVVAVIDTGIDISHPDLTDRVWTNPDETPDNGVDDDGNGYTDDVHGWDFHNDDATVFDPGHDDESPHGTHVAGTVAATADTDGVVGVAPGVTVLPLKAMDELGGTTSAVVEAIEYADEAGADVINASFTGFSHSQALRDAIAAADAVFVTAAGNQGWDTDVDPVYPAVYDIAHLLAVAAVDNRGDLPDFSNRGDETIDLGGPGVSVLSAHPEGWAYASGTSMAAPHVAGVAALVASSEPWLGRADVANRLRATVEPLDSLEGKTETGGMVNAHAALTAVDDGDGSLDSASGTAEPGGTVATGAFTSDAPPDHPFQAAVTTPTGGDIELLVETASLTAPEGYRLFDLELAVTAPTETVDDPLELRLRLDTTLVGEAGTRVAVFRDGVTVPPCDGAGARPDPCVEERRLLGDDTLVTIRTTEASTWNVGAVDVACPADLVPADAFDDVDPDSTHADAVDCVAWWDVTRGTGDGDYSPAQPVTRGQMAAFLVKMLEGTLADLPEGGDAFDDDDGTTHEAAIETLAATGIVAGFPDGTYRPTALVTRGQMATFLVRTYEWRTDDTITPTQDWFSDDDGTAHEDNIDKAAEAGFAQGGTDGRFRPAADVRRDQMASFLTRVLERFVADDVVVPPPE